MSDLFNVVTNTALPVVRRADLRREPRKVIAAEVRKLLKELGIKGISVTAPNYSMAQSIDITFPPIEHPGRDLAVASDWRDHEHLSCPVCERSHQAKARLEEIILAAFPDLDNRSDSLIDHYDYKFSIH